MIREEAIKKINSLHYKILHTSFCNKVHEAEIEALVMAKKVLEQPQADKWIPCSERLPEMHREDMDEEGAYFMVSDPVIATDGERIYVAVYDEDVDDVYCKSGWFDLEGALYEGTIAWQPLPEPYREGDTPCT